MMIQSRSKVHEPGANGSHHHTSRIHRSVWLYARFTLSLYDIDNVGKGLDVLIEAKRDAKAAA